MNAELVIFARFHAKEGQEAGILAAILEQLPPTRAEPGCLNIRAYHSIRDPKLFFIYSRWKDEATFELHAGLPHTVRFIGRVEPLIDHPFDAARVTQIA